jgi:hypothetical protein
VGVTVDTSHAGYTTLRKEVQQQIKQLQVVFAGIEAKEKEREWIKNKAAGELDETRLVDGLAGDKLIYKSRGEPELKSGLIQRKKKRVVFAFDCSQSMTRGNGWDRRLDRMVQVAVMLMDTLQPGSPARCSVLGRNMCFVMVSNPTPTWLEVNKHVVQ